MRCLTATLLSTTLLLSACGLGETAATASLQAEQAAQLQAADRAAETADRSG